MKKETINTIISKAVSVIGFIFKNKKVIVIALSLVGLGGVSGAFTVVADTVCSMSAICE